MRLRYDRFFRAATGFEQPFGYHCRLACGDDALLDNPETLVQGRESHSLLINVPTGRGKTAAVVLASFCNRVRLRNAEPGVRTKP